MPCLTAKKFMCVVFIKCYQGSVINHRLRYETFSPLWSFIVRIKREGIKKSDARTKLIEPANVLYLSTQHTDAEGIGFR